MNKATSKQLTESLGLKQRGSDEEVSGQIRMLAQAIRTIEISFEQFYAFHQMTRVAAANNWDWFDERARATSGLDLPTHLKLCAGYRAWRDRYDHLLQEREQRDTAAA